MQTTIQRLNPGEFFKFLNGNQTYQYIGEEYENGIIISIYRNHKEQTFETEYDSIVIKL